MFEWMLHNKCFCLTVWLENILLHRCLHSNYFCINKKYFLFCDWTWKESIQCILSVKLRAPQRIWFHANCHHSNYQIIEKYFLFCDPAWTCLIVYIISHKCTAIILVWRLGLKTFHGDFWLKQYKLHCTSIIHLSKNIFCFMAWLENI